MSDTPYELRAGLLGQAEGILAAKFNAECDQIRFLIHEKLLPAGNVKWPQPPSAEDIIAEAEKLYGFVKKK